jgi:hypothetical protein
VRQRKAKRPTTARRQTRTRSPRKARRIGARWTPLQQKLDGELAKSLTLRSRISELTVELSGIGPLNARRGGVESERQRLVTEAQLLDGNISADKATLEAIREEGRRAGALPGWFR